MGKKILAPRLDVIMIAFFSFFVKEIFRWSLACHQKKYFPKMMIFFLGWYPERYFCQ